MPVAFFEMGKITFSTILMIIVVLLVSHFFHGLVGLGLSILSGAAIYLAMIWIFNVQPIREYLQSVFRQGRNLIVLKVKNQPKNT
jgi:peptidoglycan biosynthesis protein MviN/MurJ (putative lipid II flippase)